MTDELARTRVLPPRVQDGPRWRVDWARVVANLQALGLSLQAIADWVGISRQTLSAYVMEDAPSEPQHVVGELILRLWFDVTGYSRADVPMRRRPLSVSEILRAHQ